MAIHKLNFTIEDYEQTCKNIKQAKTKKDIISVLQAAQVKFYKSS